MNCPESSSDRTDFGDDRVCFGVLCTFFEGDCVFLTTNRVFTIKTGSVGLDKTEKQEEKQIVLFSNYFLQYNPNNHCDKMLISIINELKEELQLKPRFQIVPYIKDDMSPMFTFSPEQMQFTIDIGADIDIDQYFYRFTED